MNKFLTFIISFCFIVTLNSQAQDRDIVEINAHLISYNKKIPFTNINVIDSRFDTTKIGYIPKGNSFRKLTVAPCFSCGIENNLNSSLKLNFDSTRNASLVIVIKNFWLRDAFIKKQTEFGSQCVVKLELYMKKGTDYFPLLRIDTVYTHDEPLKTSQSDLVTLPFERSLSQLEGMNFEKVLSTRKLTWQEIEQFNNKRFQKAVYSTNFQKGIYLTFKDFLDNRIDSRPFKIKLGKLTDQLYLVEKDGEKILTDFWAFCDGNKLYINSSLNFYELTKADKGFEFWGNAELIGHTYRSEFRSQNTSAESIAQGLGNYGLQKLMTPKSNYLRPFQIDMENGTIY